MKKLFLLFTLCSTAATAQQFSDAIEDNSFFIEEAYNQEDGVIQHIFTGTGGSGSQFNEMSFTEEWPVMSQTHQLSITIPYSASNTLNGAGDIMLNYRYQLTNENGLAISPRFSLILPTGNHAKGLGDGVVGMQTSIPVSKRWTNEFITHFNAGFTLLPNVSTYSRKENITTYIAGASGIFLATEQFNILSEILYSSTNGSGEIILSPGVRYAIDIGSLQIVPGLAFPFYFASGREDNGAFLYLSFEHPY